MWMRDWTDLQKLLEDVTYVPKVMTRRFSWVTLQTAVVLACLRIPGKGPLQLGGCVMWWCPYVKIGQNARSRGSRNLGGAARWSIGVNTQQAGTPQPRREARYKPHM